MLKCYQLGPKGLMPHYRFFNGGTPASFCFYFLSFKLQFYKKIVDFSRVRTRIVGIEGEHDDHLTTTTALNMNMHLQFVHLSLSEVVKTLLHARSVLIEEDIVSKQFVPAKKNKLEHGY